MSFPKYLCWTTLLLKQLSLTSPLPVPYFYSMKLNPIKICLVQNSQWFWPPWVLNLVALKYTQHFWYANDFFFSESAVKIIWLFDKNINNLISIGLILEKQKRWLITWKKNTWKWMSILSAFDYSSLHAKFQLILTFFWGNRI